MFRPIALALALTLPHTATATLEPQALISRLAKPAPASVAFKEARFSPLLREPLVVAGELSYSGPTSLERRVIQPYRETTQIRGESVQVEREGEPRRSFALKRAPELRGLLNGFSGLLAGNAAAIKRSFDAKVSGTEDSWSLELTPLDAKARRRLQQIVVDGRADSPSCFTMLTADGGASVLLLGATAQRDLPQPTTLDALKQMCRAE
jgi:hypothetical protein